MKSNMKSKKSKLWLNQLNYGVIKIKSNIELLENFDQKNESIFFHSEHSEYRSAHRGISDELISMVIYFGKLIETPSSKYYIFCKKYLNEIKESFKNRIENLVVIISKETNLIITCYFTNDPIKLVKRKLK